MRKGYKLTNVSNERPNRHTSRLEPRRWHGLGITLEPGDSFNLEELPGEVAVYLGNDTGTIKIVEINLLTGEPLVSEEAPAPAPKPPRQQPKSRSTEKKPQEESSDG